MIAKLEIFIYLLPIKLILNLSHTALYAHSGKCKLSFIIVLLILSKESLLHLHPARDQKCK